MSRVATWGYTYTIAIPCEEPAPEGLGGLSGRPMLGRGGKGLGEVGNHRHYAQRTAKFITDESAKWAPVTRAAGGEDRVLLGARHSSGAIFSRGARTSSGWGYPDRVRS